jgi:hypothetical protein
MNDSKHALELIGTRQEQKDLLYYILIHYLATTDDTQEIRGHAALLVEGLAGLIDQE